MSIDTTEEQTQETQSAPIEPQPPTVEVEEEEPKKRSRWLDGSRRQQPMGRWLVVGPSEQGETTSKTLVRGEFKANKLATALNEWDALYTANKELKRVAQANTNNPDPENNGKTLSFVIDHGYYGSRRQRRAAGL